VVFLIYRIRQGSLTFEIQAMKKIVRDICEEKWCSIHFLLWEKKWDVININKCEKRMTKTKNLVHFVWLLKKRNVGKKMKEKNMDEKEKEIMV